MRPQSASSSRGARSNVMAGPMAGQSHEPDTYYDADTVGEMTPQRSSSYSNSGERWDGVRGAGGPRYTESDETVGPPLCLMFKIYSLYACACGTFLVSLAMALCGNFSFCVYAPSRRPFPRSLALSIPFSLSPSLSRSPLCSVALSLSSLLV